MHPARVKSLLCDLSQSVAGAIRQHKLPRCGDIGEGNSRLAKALVASLRFPMYSAKGHSPTGISKGQVLVECSIASVGMFE
jgi:hypothetical protein